MRRAPEHPCAQCGANAWRITGARSIPSLVWGWLAHGRSGIRPEWVCGRCGNRMGSAAVAMYGGRRPSRVVTLVRTLRGARSAQPAPLPYVIAFALGAAAGALLDGLSWWATGLLFVAGVWVVFASSIFWGPRSPHRSVRTMLTYALAPSRAMQREDRSQADRFRRTALPLYGLPASYEGARWLGGWGGYDEGDLSSATLAHGEPMKECLRVEITMQRHDGDLAHAIRELAHHAALESLQPNPDMGDLIRRTNEIMSSPDAFATARVPIDVDGVPVTFSVMSHGTFWVGVAPIGDAYLRLHGERFPLDGVALARVTDVEPYITGTQQMRTTHW